MSKLVVELFLGKAGAINAATQQDVVIVVDVLRASSTIITLLDQGVNTIKPVRSFSNWSGTMIGEKNGIRLSGCGLNNSPAEILKNVPKLKHDVALKTTNGSGCIIRGKNKHNHLLIGSSLNAKACAIKAAQLATEMNGFIGIVLAGRKELMALDDLYVGSIIFNHLPQEKVLVGSIKPKFVEDLYLAISKTKSAERLSALGYDEDVFICSQQDVSKTVPYFDGHVIRSFCDG